MTTTANDDNSFFGHYKPVIWLLPLLILAAGILVRFVDLTDPPLDFNPTRQLRSALIARGIYYEHDANLPAREKDAAVKFANQTGVYEPPIFEHLVAWTYLLTGGEKLWIARIWAILFWTLGAVGLFLFAREVFGLDGGLVALCFFLFLPFGVFASRSFQPDPLMVAGIIFTCWMLYRWHVTHSWKYALLAGIIGGFAMLVKAGAAFFIGGMMLALLLAGKGILHRLRDRQFWVMAGLMLVQPAVYYLLTIGNTSASLFAKWTLELAYLWVSPSFYMRWLIRVNSLVGLFPFFLGLIGVILYEGKAKPLLAGYWLGYGVFGLAFPHHIMTHDYYHLALVPLLGLSLAPVGQILFAKARKLSGIWQMALLGVLAVGILYPVWIARSVLVGKDYRAEPAFWECIGKAIPDDGNVIALTQDYGHRLRYYGWRGAANFPSRAQQKLAALHGNKEADFAEFFRNRTAGFDYFVVTSLNQLRKQPELKQLLQSGYPVLEQGDGFIIYDLRHPFDD